MWTSAGAPLALVAVSFFVVLLAENSRIPFDDPNTHLELTMIHEVIVLDHSGPMLALLQWAAAMKLFVFAALAVRLAVPLNFDIAAVNWLLFVAATMVVMTLPPVLRSVHQAIGVSVWLGAFVYAYLARVASRPPREARVATAPDAGLKAVAEQPIGVSAAVALSVPRPQSMAVIVARGADLL